LRTAFSVADGAIHAKHRFGLSTPQHVWQKRFYDFHVWRERKRVEKLRCMHRNLVKARLVLEPEHWAWSSYRSYAYSEPGRVMINQWPRAELRHRPAV
jgi:hypothetical protein